MSKLTYQDIKTHPHPICFHLVARRISSSSSQRSQNASGDGQENQAVISNLAAFFKIYNVKSHKSFDLNKTLDKNSLSNAPENIISFMKKYISTAGIDTKKLSFTINLNPKNLNSILDIVQKASQLQELDLNFQSSSSDETSCQRQQQTLLFAQQLRRSFSRLKHVSLSFPAQDDDKAAAINPSQQFFNIIAKRFSSLSSSLSFTSKNTSSLSHSLPSVGLASLAKELSKSSNQCRKIIFDFSFQGGSLLESLQDFLRNIPPSQCNIQSLKINLSYCKEMRFSSLITMLEMIRESMPSLKKLEVDLSYCTWAAIEENFSSKISDPSSGSKLANLTLNFWSNMNLNDSMIRELMRSTILIQGSSLRKLNMDLGKSSITSKTMIALLFEIPGLMKCLKEIVYNFSQCQKITGSELEKKEEQEKYQKKLMKLKVQIMNCRGLQMKHLQALEERLVHSFVNKGCLVNFNLKELIKKKSALPSEECTNKEANKK